MRDPTKDLLNDLSRNAGRAFCPADDELLRQAQEEYNQLREAHARRNEPRRSFWDRFLGWW